MLPPARTASCFPALGCLIVAYASALALPCHAQQISALDGPATPKAHVEHTNHFTTWSYQGGPAKGHASRVGLFATSGDTSVDLTSPTEMLDGPSGSLFDQAAGIGWHSGHMSAMFGYMKPSSIKSATSFRADDYTPAYKSSARVGLGWSLHF